MEMTKTRTILLTVWMVLLPFSVSAQDAMPTKHETVNFLNKKAKEVVGRPDGTNTWEVQAVTLKDDKLQIERKLTGNPLQLATLNPANIIKVVPGKHQSGAACSADGTSWLSIVTEPKMIEFDDPNNNPRKFFHHFATIQYVCSPGTAEKLTKAILHLRDLTKAEDDLF